MKISVIIPARNEEECIAETLRSVAAALRSASLAHEIIVVDDGSSDGTSGRVREFAARNPDVLLVSNPGRNGFGMAVRAGLEYFTGDAVAVFMADGSDSAEDLVACCRKLEEGYDCVFGSRFIHGSRVTDYPVHKLVVNRCANWFVQALFGLRLNDTTNAFKVYRREVIEGVQPLISPHFNLTVEMPLKAIVRGYSYAIVPISWTNRTAGISKLKLKEMGSRYLFIVLYIWLEKILTRGDYRRQPKAAEPVKSSQRARN